jgi:hypothetical protein
VIPYREARLVVDKTISLISALVMRCCLQAVELHYPSNWYHSNIHAADVVQALAAIIMQDDLMSSFTELEILSLVLAAIIHDVNHTGVEMSEHVLVAWFSHTPPSYMSSQKKQPCCIQVGCPTRQQTKPLCQCHC